MIKLETGGTTAIRLQTGRDPTIVLDSGGGGGSVTPPHPGPYEATPSSVEQLFEVAGKRMVQDFTVHAIPSNYGLITWNGSVITVS